MTNFSLRVTKILCFGIPPGFRRLTVTVVKDYHAAVRIILQLFRLQSFSVNDAFFVGQQNVAHQKLEADRRIFHVGFFVNSNYSSAHGDKLKSGAADNW